jgi:hypothetical protein
MNGEADARSDDRPQPAQTVKIAREFVVVAVGDLLVKLFCVD